MWDPNDEHAHAGEWDAEGRARDVLALQARSARRLKRLRVWGSLADFHRLCRYVLAIGGCTFAVDEGHVYAPHGAERHHPFRELVLRHRHVGVALVVVGWRPAELPRYLTAAAPAFVLFRTTRRIDLRWIADETDAATAARLPALEVGEHVEWNPSSPARRRSKRRA